MPHRSRPWQAHLSAAAFFMEECMEQSKTLAVSVSAKEFVTYQCSQCGHCCRHIEGCVMVESLDAYRMAKHLREQHCGVSSTDDVLLQYCEPTPLTDEGYPIYTLKTGIPFTHSKRLEQKHPVFFCRATSAVSMLPVLEPAAFTRFRRGPVSAAGNLNTASVLMITSSITSTAGRCLSKTGCTATSHGKIRNS